VAQRSLEAAEQLAEKGIEMETLDLRTLKPLDEATIVQLVMKTGKVLIMHESCKTGSYGGELAVVIAGSEAFDFLDTPI
jgi:pyruvate/2-oxoglutarate/acetoin dehydrogenase E1 component